MTFDKDAKKLILLCWLSYMINYLARYGLSTSMNEMVSFGIFSISFAGVVGTAFLGAYGLGQFVNGLIGDKIHPKYMISIGLGASAIMNILVGLSNNPYVILVLWCLNGYFCSMLWAPLVRSFSEFLSREHQSIAGMTISSAIPVGNIVTYLAASLILRFASWRFVFIILGAIVLVMAFVWYFSMNSLSDYFKEVAIVKAKELEEIEGKKKEDTQFKKVGLFRLILTTGVIFTIGGIFFNGILKEGVTLWVPTYISQFFDKDASVASMAAIILPIFNLVGVFLAVRLFKHVLKNEMLTAGIMFTISSISLAALYFFGHINMFLALVLVAFSTAAMLGVNTMFLTFIPLNFSNIKKSSSISGILNAFSYIASSISSVAIGSIVQSHGWNVTILMWTALAVLGALVSYAGIRYWTRGKDLLQKI